MPNSRNGVPRRALPKRLGLLNPQLRELAGEVDASLRAAAGIPRIGISHVDPDVDETRSEAGILHSTRNEPMQGPSHRTQSLRDGISRRNAPGQREQEPNPFNDSASLLAELGQRSLRARTEIASHNVRLTAIEALTKRLEAFDERLLNANNRNAGATTQNAFEIRRIGEAQNELIEKQGNVQERIANIDARLDTHVDQIHAMTDNINALSDKMSKLPLPSTGGQQPQAGALARFKIDLPQFSAAPYDQPVQFIRKLLNYFEATRIQENNFHLVIDQALKGSAHDWWIYSCEQVVSIRDFRDRFFAKYWNHVVQDRVRQELEFGYYRAEHNLSTSEYATRLFNKVIMLDDPPSEPRIIQKFSRHFDEQIQQATLARNIQSMDGFLELLENIEQIGLLNATRNSTYQDFNKSSQDVRRYNEYERNRPFSNYQRDSRYNGPNNRQEWRSRSPAPSSQAHANEPFRSSTPRPFENDRSRGRSNSMERRPDSARPNESRGPTTPPNILRRAPSPMRVNEINAAIEEAESSPPTEN